MIWWLVSARKWFKGPKVQHFMHGDVRHMDVIEGQAPMSSGDTTEAVPSQKEADHVKETQL